MRILQKEIHESTCSFDHDICPSSTCIRCLRPASIVIAGAFAVGAVAAGVLALGVIGVGAAGGGSAGHRDGGARCIGSVDVAVGLEIPPDKGAVARGGPAALAQRQRVRSSLRTSVWK